MSHDGTKKVSPIENSHGEGHERLHEWFGLSYANYLTIPRAVLQSLPDQLQGRLAEVLEKMDAVCMEHHLHWPGRDTVIEVRLRRNGKFIKDPLADYERGRRRVL